MSKTIVRKTTKLFDGNHTTYLGGSGSPTSDIAEFGTAVAGTPAYSQDPALIQTSAWLNGWQGAVTAIAGGTTQPNLEDVNAVEFVTSYFLNYLYQEGIPEWDINTTYYQGSFAKSSDGLGTLYVSLQNNNTGNGLNTAYWIPYIQNIVSTISPQIARAWVCFDGRATTGTNCTIIGGAASYNVDHVYKVSTGVYDIFFSSGALPSANYSFTGSCGTQNGVNSIAGDNNIITGAGPIGTLGIRTASQLRVYAWEPYTGSGPASEDSSCISIQVFGV